MSCEWITADGVAELVSFVVPTHNRAALLSETLAALIGQSYRPIQIVVVDDGSADNTQEVVESIAKNQPNDVAIEYFRQEQSSAPAARNAGAMRTTGEYIVFMDDDDLARTDFLRSRIDALKSTPGANLSFGLWHIFDVVDGQYRVLSNRGGVPEGTRFDWYAFFGFDWQLLLQGCVIRRALVAEIGPWTLGLKKSQDMEYKARLLAHPDCHPVYAGPEEPVYYRMHEASISGGINEDKLDSYLQVIDQMEEMTKQRDDYETSKDRTADCLWTHSFWLYGLGDTNRGYRQLKRAKLHDASVCRRKGFLPALMDSVGLDSLIGPLYYTVSRLKKLLGFSERTVLSSHGTLPSVSRMEY
jgi:hypothetical protein